MRKHRFFTAHELYAQQTVQLEPDVSHQICRVLRLPVGATIFLFNNSGVEFVASIQDIKRALVTVNITAELPNSLESPCQINLGQVLGKDQKIDLVIQKATELGVHSITPLYSEHAVIKFIPERMQNKLVHWQKIAIAACCQCGRNIVPTIHAPQNINTWMMQNSDPLKLLLAPDPAAKKLSALKLNAPITILIGPEGGLSDQEINHALEHNFTLVNLGPRILRTETAGLATIAILQTLLGDM